ncbi:MAG: hypothetical protein ACYC3I_11380 [Gemmataceae bacterium]
MGILPGQGGMESGRTAPIRTDATAVAKSQRAKHRDGYALMRLSGLLRGQNIMAHAL